MHIHSNILVLDNGMYSIKTGFAGDEAPRHLERSLIGVCKNKTISRKIHHKEFYSGQDILSKREILNIKSPVRMVDYSHIEDNVRDYLEGSNLYETNEDDPVQEKLIEFKKENKKKESVFVKDTTKLISKSTGEFTESDITGGIMLYWLNKKIIEVSRKKRMIIIILTWIS
jgi:actin-related protein